MANIGLRSFLYGKLDEATGTYEAPKKLAGAIEFKEDLTTNDSKLYADDVLEESDTSVTGGKITLGVDDDDDAIFAPLLGKSVEKSQIGEEEVNVVTSRTNDEPAAIGFGYISRKNKGRYKAYFYPKIKFAPYSVEGKTKEEKLEYTTPSVEGTLFPLEDETYRKEATVENLELAVKALESFFVQNTAEVTEPTAGEGA